MANIQEEIQIHAKTWGNTFGLRAFPGEVFRISEQDSYLTPEGCVLQAQKFDSRSGRWVLFAKGTLKELNKHSVIFGPGASVSEAKREITPATLTKEDKKMSKSNMPVLPSTEDLAKAASAQKNNNNNNKGNKMATAKKSEKTEKPEKVTLTKEELQAMVEDAVKKATKKPGKKPGKKGAAKKRGTEALERCVAESGKSVEEVKEAFKAAHKYAAEDQSQYKARHNEKLQELIGVQRYAA